jgi:hypothetical protein
MAQTQTKSIADNVRNKLKGKERLAAAGTPSIPATMMRAVTIRTQRWQS